jgi:hypothetical protein
MKRKIISVLLSVSLISQANAIPQASAARADSAIQDENPKKNDSSWLSLAMKYVLGGGSAALILYCIWKCFAPNRAPVVIPAPIPNPAPNPLFLDQAPVPDQLFLDPAPVIEPASALVPAPVPDQILNLDYGMPNAEETLADRARVCGALCSRFRVFESYNTQLGCSTYCDDCDPGLYPAISVFRNSLGLNPPVEYSEEQKVKFCRKRLRLYGVPLVLVAERRAMGSRAATMKLAVRIGDKVVAIKDHEQKLAKICVPICWRFNGRIEMIRIFRGCRDARYVRSEISKVLCVKAEDIKIADQQGRVYQDLGNDREEENVPIFGEVGNTADNPIVVDFDPNGKVGFASGMGYFGDRPVPLNAGHMALLESQDTPQFERILIALRYLNESWSNLPAVVRREENRRVIAFGDIHANKNLIEPITRIMRDPSNRDAMFVFTGDYVDRGAPNPRDVKNGIQNNVDILIAMALWQREFGERVIFLRGNHETDDSNSRYGLSSDLKKEFGFAAGKSICEATNNAFRQLPIVASIGNSLFCHGSIPPGILFYQDNGEIDYDNALKEVPDEIFDLSTLEKARAEEKGSVECCVLWSDINFGNPGIHVPSRRGAGYEIGYNKQIEILEKLKYNGKALKPRFLVRGHAHEDGGKVLTGRYLDSSPVELTCVIGSYNQQFSGFGYVELNPAGGGTLTHFGWDGLPKR